MRHLVLLREFDKRRSSGPRMGRFQRKGSATWPRFDRCAVAVLALVAMPGVFGQSLQLDNARLIIGNGSVLEQASMLIQDGLITAVGYELDGQGAEVLDLSGMTVMPTLIDGHAHLGYQGPGSWGARNYTPDNLVDNLQRYAYYGFGAVFSAGSDPASPMWAIQARLDAADFLGARPLFAAGMAPPGQGPNNQFLTEALAIERATGMQILHGLSEPVQARQAVRDVAAQGLRFVKLWVDDRGGTQQKLSPEIYRAVIDESRALGLKVFVHQQYAADIPPLLDAGVNGFLHGRLGAEFGRGLARQTAGAAAFVVPNLGLAQLRREAIGEDSFLRETLTEAALKPIGSMPGERVRAPLPDPAAESELRQSLAQLLVERVDIVLGTDAGAVPDHHYGYTGHRELEIYVRLGMTAMQALEAGTGVAARQLGLLDTGVLAPGRRADLLILAANPLDDIRNTRAIESVYLGGRAVDRDALRTVWTNANVGTGP